jgi:transcription initiation factor TFIIIB Brf1 subunit/transcription initiation factor TFIIB
VKDQGNKKQKVAIPERLSTDLVRSYASKFCQMPTSELMAREASQIICAVNERRRIFFSGKSEKGLLSGIFYFLCMKYKIARSKKEIACCLKTTEITVRFSYQSWIANFPDLFSEDVTNLNNVC